MRVFSYQSLIQKKEFLFVCLLLVVFISCSKDETTENQPRRLVLVYMIADNNLDYFAVSNINDMEKGYDSNLDGDLLVYIDRGTNATPSHPYLMQIEHDTTATVTSKIVRTYPETNSTSAENLKQVMEDAMSYGDYSSVGLVLWSHGSAWLPPGTSLYSDRSVTSSDKTRKISIGTQRSFGYDEIIENNKDSACEMDVKELESTLSGYNFDFIMFDACYMGSIEVAYEFRNVSKYFIASSAEILSAGFPYQQIVPLFYQQEINPSAIARQYYNYYSSQKGSLCSGTVSVVDLPALKNFAYDMNLFNNELYSKGINKDSIFQFIDSLQQYDRLKISILYDCKQLIEMTTSRFDILNTPINNWKNIILSEYHTNLIFNALSLENCNGLSIYIPNSKNEKLNEYYKTLSWYKDSGYDKIFPLGY